MIVKCVSNDVATVTDLRAGERVRRWVNAEGKYNDLEPGREYQVQAIVYFDDELFFYLHSIEVSDYPYPYVSELFKIIDSSLPIDWEVGLHAEKGGQRFRRLGFPEWARDNSFYEKLIDGDSACISAYLNNRKADEAK